MSDVKLGIASPKRKCDHRQSPASPASLTSLPKKFVCSRLKEDSLLWFPWHVLLCIQISSSRVYSFHSWSKRSTLNRGIAPTLHRALSELRLGLLNRLSQNKNRIKYYRILWKLSKQRNSSSDTSSTASALFFESPCKDLPTWVHRVPLSVRRVVVDAKTAWYVQMLNVLLQKNLSPP